MADPIAAHIEAVAVTATDTDATPADTIDGLTEASLSRTSDVVERNYLAGGAYKRRVKTLKDTSASLSGHFYAGDAPQQALRDAYGDGSTVFVTFTFDSNVTTGEQTGERIPMLVESYEEKHTSGGVIEFTCSLQGNGTPVAIMKAA